MRSRKRIIKLLNLKSSSSSGFFGLFRTSGNLEFVNLTALMPLLFRLLPLV